MNQLQEMDSRLSISPVTPIEEETKKKWTWKPAP